MSESRIVIGTAELPQKGKRYFQPTVKECYVDEWRALGHKRVQIVKEGHRIVIEPVEPDNLIKEAP